MAGMDFGRLRAGLDEDYRLMTAALEATDPVERVPGCPDWDVAQLGFHVAEVYGYVTESIRTGHVPLDELPQAAETDPVRAVELAYAALTEQFDTRDPADFAPTWYGPDQSVGFWIRRMAHETSIHRLDAELAAGLLVNPVPDDLAADGIDEFLTIFVGYRGTAWRGREAIARLLEAPDGRPVVVRESGGRAWQLTATPAGITAADLAEEDVSGSGAAGAVVTAALAPALTISGPAPEVLAWLWNRSAESEDVQVSGDPLALAQFGAFRAVVTR